MRIRSNAHAQGQAYDITPDQQDFDPGPSTRSIPLDYPGGLSEGLSAYLETQSAEAAYLFGVRNAISTPDLSLDLATRIAPPTSATWDPRDANRPVYSWTTTASPISANGIAVRISWVIPDNGEMPGMENPWTVIAPPDTTQVRVPELLFGPVLPPTSIMSFAISYYADSTQNGYRDFIRAPLSVRRNSSGHVTDSKLGQAGTLHITTRYDAAGGI